MKEKELRDEFAMAALGPLIEGFDRSVRDASEAGNPWSQKVMMELLVDRAHTAYFIADACMAERGKKP